MHAIKFKDFDLGIGNPISMTDEECASLPVKRVVIGGHFGIESHWKLTPEELEKVKETGIVKLTVMGTTTPPVFLEVAEENTEITENKKEVGNG